ncbi:MAG: glycosyltransferase family 2 protein [Phocaeicola sp.]|uniref:glycosyltransferase family 2 protein n=1 Tax=Phocaeicola sp. TaxID=2773926 RepID=UPI003FA0FD9A
MDNNHQDTQPLMVSIRCTAYNHEPYIRQCLEGFIMQQTNFRFEAIVHDDASTDKTAEIIKEYAEKYPDIIKPIYETENQFSKHDGTIRRIMDKACTGKYIAMCEGDDYWTDPLKLQKQFDFMEKNLNYNICVHNAIKHNCKTGENCLFNKNLSNKTYTIKDLILKKWFTPTASFFYRNNIAISNEWAKRDCNGDMILLYTNCMKGNLYYMEDVMSVYNYLTEHSLSIKADPLKLYQKKINLYKILNEITHYKYFYLTYYQILSFEIKKIIRKYLK